MTDDEEPDGTTTTRIEAIVEFLDGAGEVEPQLPVATDADEHLAQRLYKRAHARAHGLAEHDRGARGGGSAADAALLVGISVVSRSRSEQAADARWTLRRHSEPHERAFDHPSPARLSPIPSAQSGWCALSDHERPHRNHSQPPLGARSVRS